MLKLILCTLLFCSVLFSQETIDSYTTIDNMTFQAEYNKHGVVLTSEKEYSGSTITIYVGKSCDVYSKVHGEGKWDWTNAGCAIHFENGPSFIFPHQVFAIESNGCSL